MLDHYNRDINYLRISITDRCNLRCTYCMPEEGINLLKHEDILSYEEIIEIVKTAISFGINKIRVTGGEPLIRKGIVEFIGMLSNVKGIKDLSLTTNGILLEKFATPLAEAGLKRINISLDTINPVQYSKITRGGDLQAVLRGIDAAKKAGIQPIKVNCVIMNSEEKTAAQELQDYCKKNNLELRFIHQMNLSTGHFSIVVGGNGGDCSKCNRIRLTANGMFKPCLFSDIEFNVRTLGIEEAFKKAITYKPERGTKSDNNKFHNIGG